jgi:hypothetical protein
MLLAACVLSSLPLVGRASAFSAADIEFFEKAVRPLLSARCYECHGGGKQKGNLRLDHRDFVLKGGDSGPAVVAGKPDESLLVEAINYGSYEMPPTGKLKPEEIAILTKWVSLGAPWPDESVVKAHDGKSFDLEARKQHWSFQPIVATPPPSVSNSEWPRSSIDRFILAKLEANGLQPADDADKRTLLRRAYFDLVGLPPTRDDLDRFLSDSSPGAFEKIIDELLASPHFGERWGRHWLDLVRYAETLGHEFDYPLPHAWRYRDYVVRAFNDDVPYDDFVREQIAGDLLPHPRTNAAEGFDESIIGTGFWHLHEDVHAPVDVRYSEATRFENQIDVFGKTFLGLTVACARCHDHKFDPITAADYYALAGFLKSSRRQDAALDPHDEITKTAARLAELRDAIEAMQSQFVSSEAARKSAPLRDGDVLFEDFDGDRFDGWYASGWAFGEKPRNMIADSRRLATKLTGTLRSQNFTIEHGAVLIRVAGEKARIRLVVDGYQMDVFSALLFAGLTQKIDTGGEWKWLRIEGDLANYKGHRGYFELLDEEDGWLAVDEIRFTDTPGLPNEGETGRGGDGETVDFAPSRTRPLPSSASQADFARLTAEADALANSLPQPVFVHAMQDGPGCDELLFIRGSHENTAGPVGRRFLEALSGGDQSAIDEHHAGRLQLAERLLASENPLPARVMANRVWQHLFGEGLVRSVDNFGVLGEAPSHPELLDHLAMSLREEDWSVKSLVRSIVLSRTYRMSSIPRPEAAAKIAEIDPSNRLLHAQRIRRLEGEALRDAMLAVSGELDPRIGGQSVPVHLTPFMQGRGRPGESGPLDGGGRRSLYIKVQRNFLTPMLTAFDYPPPATTVGRRNVSNVPAQALILLNDPFVIEEARDWARQVTADSNVSMEDRLARVYETAYSRLPSSTEIAAAKAFLESRPGMPEQAWSDLCHVLFNAKEFAFVR